MNGKSSFLSFIIDPNTMNEQVIPCSDKGLPMFGRIVPRNRLQMNYAFNKAVGNKVYYTPDVVPQRSHKSKKKIEDGISKEKNFGDFASYDISSEDLSLQQYDTLPTLDSEFTSFSLNPEISYNMDFE